MTNFVDSIAKVNGLELAYQLHGKQGDPVLLLIHGLSTPLTGWPQSIIKSFVRRGYQVLLVDNRDIGQSTLLVNHKVPSFIWFLLKKKLRFRLQPPYSLGDMKDDLVALLDYLALSRVHVVGASMGGMIAQLLAIYHPERIQSLTSIMSTTGNPTLPSVDKDVSAALAKKPISSSYDDRLQYHMDKWQLLAGDVYPYGQKELTQYTEGMLKRGITEQGIQRQLLAVLGAEDRTLLLNKLSLPALVLHGCADKLVKVEGGEFTAKAIPNSTFKTYPGMGHNFPSLLIPEIVDDITRFIQANVPECKNDAIQE